MKSPSLTKFWKMYSESKQRLLVKWLYYHKIIYNSAKSLYKRLQNLLQQILDSGSSREVD